MFTVIILSMIIGQSASGSTILNTRLGKIKGLSTSVTDGNNTYDIREYKNIPYAKPPLGDLRFKAAVAFGSWAGTRDGTAFGPSCMQPISNFTKNILPNVSISEDCLQLNIYTPISAPATKKSVMIWIHGGGYTDGQGIIYDGSYLAALGDVVVVTINYRLNIFGFFSTTDEFSPGNYGLWDQKLAIQWVHDNIDQYGGDSSSVTIFGESAGGFSVGLQAINSNNKGLFQRVIAQSGVSNTLLATSPIPKLAAQGFANITGCPIQLNADTMNCLRNKTAHDLLDAFIKMSILSFKVQEFHIEIAFAPVVDGKFLNDTPQTIINGKGPGFDFYKSLDVIIGNCESEGSLLVSEAKSKNLTNLLKVGISSDYFCNNIISTFSMDYFNNTHISQPVCDKYIINGNVTKQSMNAVNFYGDVFMYSPAIQSLNAHAAASNRSHFQYLSKRYSIFSKSQEDAPWFVGPGHASELPFLFPFGPLSNENDDDLAYSILLMKYWSNFAKKGNPNAANLPVWSQYDLTNKSYALLDANVTVQQSLYKNRMAFWLKTFPGLLIQTSTPSSMPTTESSKSYTGTSNTTVNKPTTKNPDGGNGAQMCTLNFLIILLTVFISVFKHYINV